MGSILLSSNVLRALSTSQVPPSKTKIVASARSHGADRGIKSIVRVMEMRELQKNVVLGSLMEQKR